MKLEELTKEQESKLEAYEQKWSQIGLSTEKSNHRKAEAAMIAAYKVAGLAPPEFIWLDSPMEGAIGAALLDVLKEHDSENKIGAPVWAKVGVKVWDKVRDKVRDNVRAKVWAKVGDKVGDKVRDKVRDNVRDKVMAKVWAKVRDNVRDKVWAKVGDKVRDKVWDKVGEAGYGQHDAGWLSFYSFFLNECGMHEECSDLKPLMDLAENCSWFWPLEGICILTEKPTEIHLNEQGDLHNFNGAALLYPDGWGLYFFNGVDVGEGYANMPVKKFTKNIILKEQNADIRREMIRKIGNEHFIKLLKPKVADEEFGYKLFLVDLEDGRDARPFLYMVNPSMRTVHVEGVQNAKTVREAICFRNSLSQFALPIDLDGTKIKGATNKVTGTYHQQGDALFFPVESIPGGLKERADRIAVDGLRRHLAEGKDVKVYEGYVDAPNGCVIRHPEHGEIGGGKTELPPGKYETKQVMEYDHWLEEARKVID